MSGTTDFPWHRFKKLPGIIHKPIMSESIEDTKLTGPEYELLYKLLCDIQDFKKRNVGSDRPIPAFVHRICDDELFRLSDKMHRHMHKFHPNYFNSCC